MEEIEHRLPLNFHRPHFGELSWRKNIDQISVSQRRRPSQWVRKTPIRHLSPHSGRKYRWTGSLTANQKSLLLKGETRTLEALKEITAAMDTRNPISSD
ncbi:hypothetical protein ACFXDH_52605 [Streptomyces sp. NPDC059467]|uniref:hypothetical protein n=1 Tax=Streptomyces sp. NPDC059467 TaxID=3346844 RepID=UPI00368DA233